MHLFCNLNFYFHTSIFSQFVMLWLYGNLPKLNNIKILIFSVNDETMDRRAVGGARWVVRMIPLKYPNMAEKHLRLTFLSPTPLWLFGEVVRVRVDNGSL